MMAALLVRTCSRHLLYTRQSGHRLPGIRYLFSDEFLKYNTFLKEKQAAVFFYRKEKENLFDTMQIKLQNSEKILNEELKSIIYLSDTESDVQLVKRCLLRYYENAEPNAYRFGPLFLRLCYNLQLVDTAFNLLTDKASKGLLSDYTSFNILLDLLYKHGQFERALEVLQEMETLGFNINRDTLILAFAVCYKLNSQRSLEKCIRLFENAENKDILPPRLALCYLCALALKQGDYNTALRAYEKIGKKDSALPCNLGLLLAAENKDEKQILKILETASQPLNFGFYKKVYFSKEVMNVAEETLKPTDSFAKYKELSEGLELSGQISPLTLDEILSTFQELDQQLFEKRKPVGRRRNISERQSLSEVS